MKSRFVQAADLVHIPAIQNRIADFQDRAVFPGFLQKVAVRTDVDSGIGHDALPKGIDWRIRHLGKELLEVPEQRWMKPGQDRQRHICSHGGGGFRPGTGHGKDLVLHVFLRVAEHLVQLVTLLLCVHARFPVRGRKILQVNQIQVQPFTVGIPAGIVGLEFLIRHDPLLLCVDHQHLAGFQPRFFHNVRRIQVKDANL